MVLGTVVRSRTLLSSPLRTTWTIGCSNPAVLLPAIRDVSRGQRGFSDYRTGASYVTPLSFARRTSKVLPLSQLPPSSFHPTTYQQQRRYVVQAEEDSYSAGDKVEEEQQQKRVFVGNLAYSVRWGALKDFMRQAGNVQYAKVSSYPDGRSKGCGIVEFSTAEEAQHAIATLNDQELNGRLIFVREDREQPGTNRGPPAKGVQLQVSDLAPNVTWRELKDLVRDSGVTPLRTDVNANAVGTVTVRTNADVDTVLAALQGKDFHGQQISVKSLGVSEGDIPKTEALAST